MTDDKQISAPTSSTSTTPSSMQRISFRRSDDFVARYANNVQVESSAFDVKMVFGILDQSGLTKAPPDPQPFVEQHTSINLSWAEMKLLIYFLQLHLAGYEKDNGKVKIPVTALPPELPMIAPPPFNNPQGERAFELMRRMRAEFLAKLSEP
jgi:hypothetical protein